MLRELTKDDWLSILGLTEERIPKALVLRGTRNLKTQYNNHRSYFTNVLELGMPNGILEDVLVGELDGISVAYASVYGAPMASEVTHVFGVLGTSLVVQTGNCGALADEIGPGDLFVATEAYCGEGASQYYKIEEKLVQASSDLIEHSKDNHSKEYPIHFGRIFTTSALFAEGDEDIEDWFSKGYSAVDMETAATFAVAEYFGMDRISILFTFDNPRLKDHIFLNDEDKDKRREDGNKGMLELAFSLIKRQL